MAIVLLIVLLLLVFGAAPVHGYSSNYGWAPSGLLGTILIVLLILFLLGRLNF